VNISPATRRLTQSAGTRAVDVSGDSAHPEVNCDRYATNWMTNTMINTKKTLDGRLLGFLPYQTGIAPAFCRDAIIVSFRPLVPQTPSQASAMQQH
jgi:hypothetical protein